MPGNKIQVGGADGGIRVKSDGSIVIADGDPCCCGFAPGDCDPVCPIPDALGLSISFAGVSLCTSLSCGCVTTWAPGGFTLNGAYCLPALGGQHCVWETTVSAGTVTQAGCFAADNTTAANVRIRVDSGGRVIAGNITGNWSVEVFLEAGGQIGKLFISGPDTTPLDCVLTFSNDYTGCVCDPIGGNATVGYGGTCTVDLASC